MIDVKTEQEQFLELMSYLPDYWGDIYDMKEIIGAEAHCDILFMNGISIVDKNAFIATLDDDGCKYWESLLKIQTNTSLSLQERRATILAKRRTKTKLSADKIKEIASAYQNGTVDVWFNQGNINIKFISIYGIPPGLDEFKKIIETAKPSHLGVLYEMSYNTYSALKSKTYGFLGCFTYRELREMKVADMQLTHLRLNRHTTGDLGKWLVN